MVLLSGWVALLGCSDEAASFNFSDVTKATFPALPEGADTPTTLGTTMPGTATASGTVGTATLAEVGAELDGEELALDDLLEMDIGPEQIEALGISREDVSRVVMREMGIVVLKPDSADLSFVDHLELWISADGLDDLQLVSHSDFPEGARESHPTVSAENLEPYIFGDNLMLTPLLDGEPPPQDTTVEVTLTVEVGVTWDGLLGRF